MAELAALNDTIQLFAIELKAPTELILRAEGILSNEERSRARRFRLPQHQRSYILSHACLRILLGEYLHVDPGSIEFSSHRWGKPALLRGSLEFNLSHSGEIAVCAFTTRCAIGVDVEKVRPISNLLEIAERFFSREESAELAATADHIRAEAFFRCWTRKEAYVKALGEGLSHSFDRFCVSLKQGEPALVSIDGCPETATNWSFFDFQPAPGYVGSMATTDPRGRIHLWPLVPASRLLGGSQPGASEELL